MTTIRQASGGLPQPPDLVGKDRGNIAPLLGDEFPDSSEHGADQAHNLIRGQSGLLFAEQNR